MSKQKTRKKLAILLGSAVFSSAISVSGVGAGLYHWNYNYYNPYLISFGNTEKGNLTVEITVPNAAGKEVWGHFVDKNGKTYVIKGDVDGEGKIIFDTTILPSPGKYNLESIWDKENPSSEDRALVPNEKLPKKAKEDIVKPEIAINATPEGKISLDFNKQLAGKEAEAIFEGLDGIKVKVRGIIEENGQLIINHKDHSLFPNNNYYTLKSVIDAKNPNQKLVNLDEIHPRIAIDKLLYDGYRDHNDKGDVFITSGLSKENANREVKAIFKDTNGETYEIEGTTDVEGRVNFDTSILPKGTWQLDKIVDAKENEIILKNKDGTEGKRNKFDLPELGPIHRPAIIIETSNPSDLKMDVDNHLKGDELVANFKGVDGKDYPLSAIVDEAGKITFDTSKLPEGQEYTLDSIKDKDGKDAINLNDPLITDDIKESFVIDKRARGYYQDQNGNEIKVPLIEDNNGKLIPDPKFVDTVENGDHLIFDNAKGILDSQGNKKPNELLSDTGQEIDKRVIANYPDLDQKDQNIYLIKDKDGNWKPDPKEVAKLPEGNKWVFDEKTSFKDSKGEEIKDDSQKPTLSDENKVIDKRPLATFKDSNDSSKVIEVPMVTNDEGKLIPDPEFVKTLPDDKKGFEYKIDPTVGFKDSKNQPLEVKTPVADNGKVIDTRPKLTFKDEYGNTVEIPLVREDGKLILDPETVKNLETGKIWTQDETVPIKYPDGVEPIAPEPTLEDKNKTIDTRVKTFYKDKDGKDQEIILIKDKDGVWKPDPKEVEKLPEGNKWIFDENAIFTDLEGNQITDPNQKPTLIDENKVIDKRPVARFEDPKDPSKTLEVPMIIDNDGKLIPNPEFVKAIPDDKKGVEYKIKEPTEFKDSKDQPIEVKTPVADNGKVIDTRPSVTYIDQDGNKKDVPLVKEGDKWVPDPEAKAELEEGKKWKHDESAGVKYPENIQPIDPIPTLEEKDKFIDTRITANYKDKDNKDKDVPLIKDKDGTWKPDPEFAKDLPQGNKWIYDDKTPFKNSNGVEVVDDAKKPTLVDPNNVIDKRITTIFRDKDGKELKVPLVKDADGTWKPDPELVKTLPDGNKWTWDKTAPFLDENGKEISDPNQKPTLVDPNNVIDKRPVATFEDPKDPSKTLEVPMITDNDGKLIPDPEFVKAIPDDKKGVEYKIKEPTEFKDANGKIIDIKTPVADNGKVIDTRPSVTYVDQYGNKKDVPLVKEGNKWVPDPEAKAELEYGKKWNHDGSTEVKYPENIQPINPSPTLEENNKLIDTRIVSIFKDKNDRELIVFLVKDQDGTWKPDPDFIKNLPDGNRWLFDENEPFTHINGKEITDQDKKPTLSDDNKVIDTRPYATYTNPEGNKKEVPLIKDGDKLVPEPEAVKELEKGKIWTQDETAGIKYPDDGIANDPKLTLNEKDKKIDTRISGTFKDQNGTPTDIFLIKDKDGVWKPDPKEVEKLPNGNKWTLDENGKFKDVNGQEINDQTDKPTVVNPNNIIDKRPSATFKDQNGIIQEIPLIKDQNGTWKPDPETVKELEKGKIWTQDETAGIKYPDGVQPDSPKPTLNNKIIDTRVKVTFKDQNGRPIEAILIKDQDGTWKPDPEFVKTLPNGYKWTLDDSAPFKDASGSIIADEAQKPKLVDPNNVIDKKVKTTFQDNPTNPTKTLEVPMIVDNNGKLIPDPEFVKSIPNDKKGVEYKIKEPMVFTDSNSQITTLVPAVADNGKVIDTRPIVTLRDEMGNRYNVPMVKEGDKWMPDKTSEEYKKIPNGQILTNEGVQQPTGGVSPISPAPILSDDFNLDRRYNVTYTSDKGDNVTIKVSFKDDKFIVSTEEDAKLGTGKLWTASKVTDADNKDAKDAKDKLDKSDKKTIDKRMSIRTFVQDEHRGVSHTNAFLSASFGVKGTNPSYSFDGKKVKFTFSEVDANGNEVSGTLKETNELTLDANGSVKWEQQGLEAGKRYKYKSISYLTDIADPSTLPDEIQTDKMFYTLNVAPTIASIRTLRSTHNTYSMADVEVDSVNGRDKFTTKTEITFNDPNNYLDWVSLMDKTNLSINMQNFDTNTNTDKLNMANVTISRNGNTLEIIHSGDLKEILAKKLYPVLSNISYTKNAINQKGKLTLDKLNGTDELVTSTVQKVMMKEFYTTASQILYVDVKTTIFDPSNLIKPTVTTLNDFNSGNDSTYTFGLSDTINLKLKGKKWQRNDDSKIPSDQGDNDRFVINWDRTRMTKWNSWITRDRQYIPKTEYGFKFKQTIDENAVFTSNTNSSTGKGYIDKEVGGANKYKIFAKDKNTKEVSWRYRFAKDLGFTRYKINEESIIGSFSELVAIANNNSTFYFNALPSYHGNLGSPLGQNFFNPTKLKTEEVFQNLNAIGMKSVNFDPNLNKFTLELNIPNGTNLALDGKNRDVYMWMMLKDNDGNTYLAMNKNGTPVSMANNGPFEFFINDIQHIGEDQKIQPGTELHFSDIWFEPYSYDFELHKDDPYLRPLILINQKPEEVYKRFWVKKK